MGRIHRYRHSSPVRTLSSRPEALIYASPFHATRNNAYISYRSHMGIVNFCLSLPWNLNPVIHVNLWCRTLRVRGGMSLAVPCTRLFGLHLMLSDYQLSFSQFPAPIPACQGYFANHQLQPLLWLPA